MKYQFKTGIDEKEFNLFVKNFSSASFMQTTNWAKVKTAWDHDFVGLYEGKKLVCTAMILKRNLFFGKKLFYIPRGFVIDYLNKDLLKEFVFELKKYSKKDGAISIKIDPFICFSEDNIQNIKKNKGIETRKSFVNNTKEIVANLEELGFKHGG